MKARMMKFPDNAVYLSDWLVALKVRYPFDGLTILTNHPKMIFFTKYDSATPSLSVAPRKNQIALIDTVYANEKKGFLLNNNKVPAGGKTTLAIVALPMVLLKLNAQSPKGTMKRIEIFACQQVRCQETAAAVSIQLECQSILPVGSKKPVR